LYLFKNYDKLRSLYIWGKMYELKEKKGRHKLFSYLLIIGLVISTLITITITSVYLYFNFPKNKILFTALFPMFMYPFSYIVYKISKKGNTQKGLKIYIIGTTVVVILAVFLFKGALSASNNLFIWIVLVSGTLIKPKYALLTSISFTIYVILLAILQYSGIYTPITGNPDNVSLILNVIYNTLVMVLAVGYLTYLNMTFLNQTKKELLYNATHDSLTNLLNRAGLQEALTEILEQHNNNKIALLFIDLDNFKEINDRLGHDAGDKLLIEISNKLKETASQYYQIARFGGDEFILFMEYNYSFDKLKNKINNNILKLFNIPYTVNQHEFEITASIGVSIYPDNSNTRKELITHADIAMYKAKKEGKNRIQYYHLDLKDIITQKIDIKNKLRKAISKNELIIHYQPQTDIKDNKILGLEALIRWKLNNEMIFPDQFIPIAEESGLIVEIGEWILEKACKDLKQWHDNGKKLSISVNMATLQFKQPNIVERIKTIIENTQIDPKYLELEITETGLMEQDNSIIDKISLLKQIGVKISIDDFGTGYSSLAYLKQFNVDKVKIDKSFIWKLEENEDDKPIIKAIIAMSQNLNLEIIAEGIETKYQKDFLEESGCKLYQGYYYSKPVSKQEIENLIIEENSPKK